MVVCAFVRGIEEAYKINIQMKWLLGWYTKMQQILRMDAKRLLIPLASLMTIIGCFNHWSWIRIQSNIVLFISSLVSLFVFTLP